MKRVLLATAALVAAVAVSTAVSLPPARLRLDVPWQDGTVAGLLHVHTRRSDGRSGPDEIAAAAARAGLTFLIFTDHGDATRTPDPPAYHAGVLCIDGVEVSTNDGHYIAIGMGPAPYPLAGESRDVVEDVRRLGGFGIAAHPDSPKPELAWRDWDTRFDALEVVNPDTSWRVRAYQGGWKPKLRLLQALGTYPFRPSETIGSLLTAAPAVVDRWTRAAASRHVVAIAGADAHAKLELRSTDPGDNRYSIPMPTYESSFRTLSVHVVPAAPLTGDAEADARSVIGSIRRGRLYTAIDAWASPPAFEFTASNRDGSAAAGEDLAPAGPVSLRVRSNAPDGFATTVWRGAEPLSADRRERDFTVTAGDAAGTYRVEIRDPTHPERPAWITSNPIYVREKPAPVPGLAPAPATAHLSLFDGRSAAGWATESDATSAVALDVPATLTGAELRLRYGLSGGSAVGQFAAATVDTPVGAAPYDRVAFTIRAEHPMRVSVQVRATIAGGRPDRWQRSVYVDAVDRDQVVAIGDMRPVGSTGAPRAPVEAIRNVMVVVDTTNTKPGASGRIWLKNVRFERTGGVPGRSTRPRS